MHGIGSLIEDPWKWSRAICQSPNCRIEFDANNYQPMGPTQSEAELQVLKKRLHTVGKTAREKILRTIPANGSLQVEAQGPNWFPS